jgi:anti-anti-sigma regulatory factor
MNDSTAPPRPERAHNLISLSGELDIEEHALLALRFEVALQRGDPIIVDLGDCTFADVEAIRILGQAAVAAHQTGLPFVVVLPYSSAAVLRRLLLELTPELSGFPIVPSYKAACDVVSRATPPLWGMPSLEASSLRELRASIWENASRCEELVAKRDALVLESRLTRARAVALRSAS